MLTHLHIKNFTLVDQLDIELHEGLTTITGETGAGKSMILDALGVTLGERTDSNKVKAGAERAEIHASFDISKLSFVKKWLLDNDLRSDDATDECILRRVITKEGRSRAYINGQTVTLQQLKALGENLIDIHNQHEHQSLLSPDTHRRLLDDFAGVQTLAQSVKTTYLEWQSIADKLECVQTEGAEMNARFQLLSYQVDELEQLDLQEGELEQLEREQRLLSNVEKTQENCQNVIDICGNDGVGLRDRINQAIRLIQELPEKPQSLVEVEQLLENAGINISEAQSDLEHFADNCEHNPARLAEVNTRLNSIYEIARKHHVPPEGLVEQHQKLADELTTLVSGDEMTESLNEALAETHKSYEKQANKLSTQRSKAAKKLSTAVNQKLNQLAMERANLDIQLNPGNGTPSRYGNERVEFLISTNPGHPAQALQRVASGGELSRISLAIQVVTAATSTTPTLVFDEVDVGIGGTTGDVVGLMLSELGTKGQIFCVTHLAQVASKAHHHLRAEKQVTQKGASSTLTTVEGEEKVIEIARMMGGLIDSKQSLDHAKQMLETAG